MLKSFIFFILDMLFDRSEESGKNAPPAIDPTSIFYRKAEEGETGYAGNATVMEQSGTPQQKSAAQSDYFSEDDDK